jgi:hypothetical protein
MSANRNLFSETQVSQGRQVQQGSPALWAPRASRASRSSRPPGVFGCGMVSMWEGARANRIRRFCSWSGDAYGDSLFGQSRRLALFGARFALPSRWARFSVRWHGCGGACGPTGF